MSATTFMLKIYRAIKSNHVNQPFGANATPVYAQMGLKGHEGVDWAVLCSNLYLIHGNQCESVYCDLEKSARITEISQNDTLGWGVVAVSDNDDGIYQHLWWHLDSINPNLKVGDTIETGDLLGQAGDTGRSTGAHLHRGLYRMGKDPIGRYYKLDVGNGYDGACDPMPFVDNQFVLDVLSNLKKKVGILTKLISLITQWLQRKE